MLKILKIAAFLAFLLIPIFSLASEWLHLSTDNFRFIYQKQHQSLLPRIIIGAEVSLHSLKKIFQYQPTEIITVIIRDYQDISSGKATALPHNTLTLDVAPFDQSDPVGSSNSPVTICFSEIFFSVSKDFTLDFIASRHDFGASSDSS